jgi:hypothetical protein
MIGGSAGFSRADGRFCPSPQRATLSRGPAGSAAPRDDAEERMDDALLAYNAGRVDALAGRRDATKAKDPATGADYRMGFLDGRIEIFRMLAGLRGILEED